MTEPIDALTKLTHHQHDIAQQAAAIFHARPPITLYEAVQAATGWKHIAETNREEFNLLFLAAQLKVQKDN